MKQILFIGDSFQNNKTGSNVFFQKILSENFETKFVLDTQNIKIAELNDKKFDAIVFFQIAPFKYLKKLHCKNIIFIPMYDSTNIDSFRYKIYIKYFKVIDFSHTLHQFHKSLGINSFYIQYFPEINEKSLAIERNSIFFWQRRNNISWQHVKILLGSNLPTGITHTNVLNAPDPNNTFTIPTEDDIKKYNIKTETWFNEKADLMNMLSTAQYYIAPRLKEGIGFSFLDAMAQGCVIIAHNDATMNEYITNNKTGYLVDFNKPQQINFSNFNALQKESSEQCKIGRKNYEQKIPQLIEFINSEPIKTPFNLFEQIYFFAEIIARIVLNVFIAMQKKIRHE